MSGNPMYQDVVDVTATYAALAAARTVGTFTISCTPTNAAVVNFLGVADVDVPWQPGEWHTLHGVDLAAIQIKGTVGDTVTIVGGTW